MGATKSEPCKWLSCGDTIFSEINQVNVHRSSGSETQKKHNSTVEHPESIKINSNKGKPN